jgi:hypothetical protein
VATRRFYDHHLRVIGQSLEAHAINVFELKSHTGRYVVNGTPDKPASFTAALKQWQTSGWKRGPRTMTYTVQDLDQLERMGRAKRVRPDALPDFYNVSNMLRTLGAYLEAKNARLLEIQKRPMTVTILYQNESGHPDVEDRTIASFYNFFVEQYGKRAHQGS